MEGDFSDNVENQRKCKNMKQKEQVPGEIVVIALSCMVFCVLKNFANGY